jgi:hypothetical protein
VSVSIGAFCQRSLIHYEWVRRLEGHHPPTVGKIRRVVVIFQENRTPDNLFQDPVLMAKGAEIATSGLNSSGNTIPLVATPLGIDYDLSHSHGAFVAMYDGGEMDGADKIEIRCGASSNCPPPNPQFMYVQASDVGPYFQMAEQYTFGDRMFQTNQGPCFPAHQFILSGTAAPTATSNLFAAENTNKGAGCAAPAGASVSLIDPSGNESSTTYPCFEHPTLSDELDSKGIWWRYYTPSAGSIWTGPNAIQHICQAAHPEWPVGVHGQRLEQCDHPAETGTDRPCEQPASRRELGRPCGSVLRPPWRTQQWRPILGRFHRECNRRQFLLVEYGRYHHLGRLGWLVRPRSPASSN